MCGEEIYFSDWNLSESGKKVPMDSQTEEPHDCPEREPFTVNCRKCGERITFSDDYVSRLGKKIPLDLNGEPHRCIGAESKPLKCHKCGSGIYFDDKAAKSPRGKMIPQDLSTGAAHQCG
jgi:hypothetical protein